MKTEEMIAFRLDAVTRKSLDRHMARLRRERPGGVITTSGTIRELINAAVRRADEADALTKRVR